MSCPLLCTVTYNSLTHPSVRYPIEAMKRMLISLLGVLALASAAWSQAGSIDKAIEAHEQQWLKSQKTHNADLLAPLLADKFINTSSEGKVTGKSETLTQAKNTTWESVEYKDFKVTVFGDTAIATGVFVGKGMASGKPINDHEQWTDTWVKMPNGQWQCVASQGTPIKM
jgi:ketosteroid isomerase-like protein